MSETVWPDEELERRIRAEATLNEFERGRIPSLALALSQHVVGLIDRVRELEAENARLRKEVADLRE